MSFVSLTVTLLSGDMEMSHTERFSFPYEKDISMREAASYVYTVMSLTSRPLWTRSRQDFYADVRVAYLEPNSTVVAKTDVYSFDVKWGRDRHGLLRHVLFGLDSGMRYE